MKVRVLNVGCLVKRAPIEEFAGDADAKAAAQRHIQIRSRPLQQMVCAHAVQHVQVVCFVRNDEKISVTALQRDETPEVSPGSIVVEPRSGRYAMAQIQRNGHRTWRVNRLTQPAAWIASWCG